MYKLILCFILLLLSSKIIAQRTYRVQGIVQDAAELPSGTIVKLITTTDSLTTATDNNGLYSFTKVKKALFGLKIRLIGFNEYINHLSV